MEGGISTTVWSGAGQSTLLATVKSKKYSTTDTTVGAGVRVGNLEFLSPETELHNTLSPSTGIQTLIIGDFNLDKLKENF